MKKLNNPLLEKAIPIVADLAVLITMKAMDQHKKNKQLKKDNIYVLKPHHFTAAQ
jgi:hypothetical protein